MCFVKTEQQESQLKRDLEVEKEEKEKRRGEESHAVDELMKSKRPSEAIKVVQDYICSKCETKFA